MILLFAVLRLLLFYPLNLGNNTYWVAISERLSPPQRQVYAIYTTTLVYASNQFLLRTIAVSCRFPDLVFTFSFFS